MELSKKKPLRLFTIFQDFISIFQTFSMSEKLLATFQEFFKNSRLCTNPDFSLYMYMHVYNKIIRSDTEGYIYCTSDFGLYLSNQRSSSFLTFLWTGWL